MSIANRRVALIALSIALLPPAVGRAQEMAAEPIVPLVPASLGGFGGPQVKLSAAAGRRVIIGGGPLLIVLVDSRVAAGVVLASTEADVEGLQLAYAGAFVEYDLRPAARLHVLPSLTLLGGAVILDPAGSSRERAPVLGVEPQLALAIDAPGATRLLVGAGWRFVWSIGRLETAPRDLGGPTLTFQLREGRFGIEPEAAAWSLSGGPSMRWSVFAGDVVHLDGGGTRVLLGRSWAVGIGGYVTRDWFSRGSARVAGGWGGLQAEHLFLPRALFRPWLAVMIAGGGFALGGETSAGLVLLEPTVGVQVTITEFLRVAAGAGYRLGTCLACPVGVDWRDVSAPSAVLELRFGHF